MDGTQKIYGNLVISQSFISTTSHFAGIGVSLKNPHFANKKDIILSIYDKDNMLLREVVLNGRNIADGKFVKFRFEPIVLAANKEFTFSIKAPQTSEEEANRNEALEVFLSNTKLQEDTDVAYVKFFKPPYPFYVLENIYSRWFGAFTKDRIFLFCI